MNFSYSKFALASLILTFVLNLNLYCQNSNNFWEVEIGAIGRGEPVSGLFQGLYLNVDRKIMLNKFICVSPTFTYSTIQSRRRTQVALNPDFLTPFGTFYHNNSVSSSDSLENLYSWNAGSLDVYTSIDITKLLSNNSNSKNSVTIGVGYGIKSYSETQGQLKQVEGEYFVDWMVNTRGLMFTPNLFKIDYMRMINDKYWLGTSFWAYGGIEPFTMIGIKLGICSS